MQDVQLQSALYRGLLIPKPLRKVEILPYHIKSPPDWGTNLQIRIQLTATQNILNRQPQLHETEATARISTGVRRGDQEETAGEIVRAKMRLGAEKTSQRGTKCQQCPG